MTKDERKIIENFLTGFRTLSEQTALISMRLDIIREKLLSPSFKILRLDENGNISPEKNQAKIAYEKACKLEEEASEKLSVLVSQYGEIERMIDLLGDKRMKTALVSRYLYGEPWIKVQHRLGCSDRQARRIAYNALDRLVQIYKNNETIL